MQKKINDNHSTDELLNLLELHLEQSVAILARLIDTGNSARVVLQRDRIRGALYALGLYERVGDQDRARE